MIGLEAMKLPGLFAHIRADFVRGSAGLEICCSSDIDSIRYGAKMFVDEELW
jgi:hypothetical protein